MLAGLLIASLAAGAPAPDPEESLILLAAGDREIGLAPRLGGRVVLFRRRHGPNALHADPAAWSAAERPPRPALAAVWKPYNGHIVWIGPQRGWWSQQELEPAKRARRDDWPPDPWSEYAAFTVDRRSATLAVLSGPPSPVTGLRLRKEVGIAPDGTVRVAVTAINTRPAPVTWDLWSNTRVPPSDRVFAEAGPSAQLRVEHWGASPWTQAGLNEAVVDGWFTFLADEPPPAGKTARVAKAFLSPSRAILAAFSRDQVFVKRFAVTPADRVAPEQAAVEIYQDAARDPAAGLLELEGHGPLTTLRPGEAMTFEETWTLADAPPDSSLRARAALLTRMFPPESDTRKEPPPP